MAFTDPYFSVQEEICKNLETAKKIYFDWNNRDPSDKSASIKISSDLKQILRNIEWDLEDIQETVTIVEGNPGRFQMSSDDVMARHRFINETRSVLRSVRSELSSGKSTAPLQLPVNFSVTAAKPNNASNTVLTNGIPPSNAPIELRTSHPLSSNSKNTSRSFRSKAIDPLSEQKQLLLQQDERLDQLGTSISALKGMSHQIGDELGDQVILLDDFAEEMAHTESRLDAATKRTARLLRLSTDRRQWCAIGWLTLILFIILLLLTVL